MKKIALIASIGFAAALATADLSFAKNGNNGGGNSASSGNNGNGNGNGGGNSSASGNNKGGNGGGNSSNSRSNGNGNGNSAHSNKNSGQSAAPVRIIRVKPVPPGQQRRNSVAIVKQTAPHNRPGGGSSALGALNAAHASEQAFANASPNSRVGKIGAYRDQVLASAGITEELEIQQDILDSLPEPTRTSDEVDSELELATERVATAEDELEDLAQQLEEAGGSDPVIEAQIESAIEELQEANEAADSLQQEADAIVAYDEATERVAELTEAAQVSDELEHALLQAAANKPITPEVEAELREILGLPPLLED